MRHIKTYNESKKSYLQWEEEIEDMVYDINNILLDLNDVGIGTETDSLTEFGKSRKKDSGRRIYIIIRGSERSFKNIDIIYETYERLNKYMTGSDWELFKMGKVETHNWKTYDRAFPVTATDETKYDLVSKLSSGDVIIYYRPNKW